MRALVSDVKKNQASITMDQQPLHDMRLQHHWMIIGLQLLVDNVLMRVIPAMTLPTILSEIVVKAPPVFLIVIMEEHIVYQILMVILQQLQQQKMTSGLQLLVDNVLMRVIPAWTLPTILLEIVVKA